MDGGYAEAPRRPTAKFKSKISNSRFPIEISNCNPAPGPAMLSDRLSIRSRSRRFRIPHEARFTNHASLDSRGLSSTRCPAHIAVPNSAAQPHTAPSLASSIRQAQPENDFAAIPRHRPHAARPEARLPAHPKLDAQRSAEASTKVSTAQRERVRAPRSREVPPIKGYRFSSSPATSHQKRDTSEPA